jgi:NADPH2:quinone reductase
MADQLFEKVSAGIIKLRIGQELPLSDIAKAHDMLEARETTGSTVLTL